MIPTLDLDAAVIKSDTAVSSELKAALRTAAARLEEFLIGLKIGIPALMARSLTSLQSDLVILAKLLSLTWPSMIMEASKISRASSKISLACSKDVEC